MFWLDLQYFIVLNGTKQINIQKGMKWVSKVSEQIV